eukprot:CAMPEP_0113467432 /NCGR_PEP_ID=MMETSP0014_2-20120614/14811_1 /TAXON_ID=2857 /ORGANISM="Nitzschia sp." /LENGTH=327 /DNA_ID=CAMNT_0000359739 /DNA_START=3 /DNA_END=982 /DNA_ORIENTATION=- /assembly_acc=CAM_ASM_000159
MRNYDVEIRADVVGNQVLIGTQLNVQDLSKGRHFLQYRNAVTIKSNLAYVMSRLANLNRGDRLLDPFCGSGTLVLEAQQIYGGTLTCIGMDLSRRSAQGAAANAEAEGYGPDRCRFVCSDARGLRRHIDTGDNSVDAICSNLPWGIQTGQNQSTSDLQTMYEVFLRNSWYVLKPYGRVVMLVLRGLQLVRTVQKLSGRFRLVHVNVIRTTNNLPSIIVVEKLPVDVQRESLKSQLSHLNQWGIQTGQNQSTSDLQTMYEVFLRNSWYVLKPYGRVVMLVLRGLQLVRTVQKLSGRFRLVHVNVIRTTNNLPSIIVVEKLPVDVQRES